VIFSFENSPRLNIGLRYEDHFSFHCMEPPETRANPLSGS